MKKMTFAFVLLFFVFVVAVPSFAGTVWLDEVISFDRPPESSDDGGLPECALGPDDNKFVSVDIPETLILAFTDNSALDGLGNDIHVYQCIAGDSDVDIYASENNTDYVYLGRTDRDVEYDLLDYFGLDYVNYLKFVGLDDGGSKDGFDLDAVKALNSGPYVPIPGAIWLLGSGLIGFVGFRKKLRN
jgi:hypothetical protein